MRRPFEFRPATRAKARLRQLGFCAGCGVDLTNLEEHTHHVVPVSLGSAANPEDAWLASLDNCVVLCGACHRRAPEGDPFANGAAALPSPYPFSHGGNAPAHAAWQRDIADRSKMLQGAATAPASAPSTTRRRG